MSRIRLSKMVLTLEQILGQARDTNQISDNEWFVTCPAHDDHNPSLHVTRDVDGSIRTHCFAGCSFAQVVEAFQGFAPAKVAPKLAVLNGHKSSGLTAKSLVPTPLEWLANYTTLGEEFLSTQSIDFSHRGKIGYVFPHSRAIKWRELSSTAKGTWDTGGDSPPPIWPELNGALPETVFITAGETDCLCLRATGVEAFALTKGEVGLPPAQLFRELAKRGVREIVYTADIDEVGKQAAGNLAKLVDEVGLECKLLDLTEHLNASLGEKDVRSLTRRVGMLQLRELLETEYLRPPDLPGTMAEFVATAPPEIPWIVTPLAVLGATTLFSGPAKAGKTTFIKKVMLAMEHGGMVLNMPVHQGRALIWTENSPIVWKAKFSDVTADHLEHIFPISRHDPRFLGKTFDENIRIVFDIASRLGCTVVVLDTLTGLAAIEEENEASQVSAALVPVSKMAQRYVIACIMVHHLGKSGVERGSTVFLSEPDILVRLEGEYAEERTLRVKNNMLVNPPEDLVFRMDEGGEYVLGVGGITDDAALAILDVLPLNQAEAISLQDIASAVKMTWDKATRDSLALQVAQLEKAGKVRRLSQGAGLPALHYRVARMALKRR